MRVTIKVKEHGPLVISLEDAASVVIVNAAGERLEPTPGKAVVLCRCGHSSRKPFCDGTHRTAGVDLSLAPPLKATVTPAAPPATA